ncbi:hypothetical protein ACG3SL_02860 [Sphingomonas sp. CJ20]
MRYEHAVGLWVPIIRHLAMRGHADAMIELADWYSEDNSAQAFGKPASSFAAAGLYRRAWRKGNARAALNAAASCFNRNDMRGYRHWLRNAANVGADDARRELCAFETRLWHSAARKIRRLRPFKKRDGLY